MCIFNEYNNSVTVALTDGSIYTIEPNTYADFNVENTSGTINDNVTQFADFSVTVEDEVEISDPYNRICGASSDYMTSNKPSINWNVFDFIMVIVFPGFGDTPSVENQVPDQLTNH